MKRIYRSRITIIIGFMTLGVLLIGCLESGEEGSAEVTVSTQALSAANVARITVSVTGDGIAEPIVHDLVDQGGQFQGIIGAIPAGTNRTFHADAFDEADALIYAGEVSGVTIEHEVRAAVFILLQQSTPPDPFDNSVPKIDGLSASAIAVAPSETVSLSVSFHDSDPADALTPTWTATCGTFNDEGSSTPVWTAPSALGSCEVTVIVSDGRGGVASASLTLEVVEGWGEAQVLVEVNSWPMVSSVTATPGRLDVGETTNLVVDVSDADEDGMSFSWSDGGGECAGIFSNASAQSPSWTAPAAYPSSGTCELVVTVDDGRWGSTTGSVMVHVMSPLEPNIAPVIDSWFMSIDVVGPGETIVLRVDAHDPEGGAVSFAWDAAIGELSTPTESAMRSEVEWTTPGTCAGGPFVVTVSVSDNEGLVTPVDFQVSCLEPDWTEMFPLLSPSPRAGHFMTYDSVRNVTVLFGGVDNSTVTETFADTWEWDGESWTEVTPTVSPPGRYGSSDSMVYDMARDEIVLFGNFNAGVRVHETWIYDSSTNTWRNADPATQPDNRGSHGMAYCPSRGTVVLFGGSLFGAEYNDTWEWDGMDWTELSPAHSPPAMDHHYMMLDTSRNVIMLFNGEGGSGGPSIHYRDIWEYDGTDWTNTGILAPSAFEGGVAYHFGRRSIMLYGGIDSSSTFLDDTWEYDPASRSWTEIITSTTLPPLRFPSIVYDALRDEIVLFGGWDSSGANPSDRTWVF